MPCGDVFYCLVAVIAIPISLFRGCIYVRGTILSGKFWNYCLWGDGGRVIIKFKICPFRYHAGYGTKYFIRSENSISAIKMCFHVRVNASSILEVVAGEVIIYYGCGNFTLFCGVINFYVSRN